MLQCRGFPGALAIFALAHGRRWQGLLIPDVDQPPQKAAVRDVCGRDKQYAGVSHSLGALSVQRFVFRSHKERT